MKAVVQNFNIHSYHEGIEIETYNTQGQLVKTIRLTKGISPVDFSDDLYFAEDGKSIFAQIGNDIYLVDSENGIETLLVRDQNFFSASPSGKVILTGLNWHLIPRDSNEYAIIVLENNVPRIVSTWKLPLSISFRPYFGHRDFLFLSDSLWVGCYADSGICSLAFFDTLFNVQYSTNDHNSTALPALASISNELIYSSSLGFTLFNISSHTVEQVKSNVPSYLHSLDISPSADFFTYTYSENQSNFFDPSRLMLFNLKTSQEVQLASGIASSGQLSPDSKLIAYFTNNDRDIQLHIVPVP